MPLPYHELICLERSFKVESHSHCVNRFNGSNETGKTSKVHRTGTGFSWDVSFFISGVAETSRVRQMKSVDAISVSVHARPPSMP